MTAEVSAPTSAPTLLDADPVVLAQRIRQLQSGAERVLVGIVGAPGAGKSTLAEGVLRELGDDATLVGMDGFHLAQRVLDASGLADIKGAPETFDVHGYLALLRRLQAPQPDPIVYAPEFRRPLEEPVGSAVEVGRNIPVVLTEGNYLLLDRPPWDQVRGLLTEVWYLDTPEELRLDRLVSRHVAFGRPPAAARERAVTGSDGRNAELIRASRKRAHVLLRP